MISGSYAWAHQEAKFYKRTIRRACHDHDKAVVWYKNRLEFAFTRERYSPTFEDRAALDWTAL